MNEIRTIVGSLNGQGKQFGVVASSFNERIVAGLIEGAIGCLARVGVSPGSITLVRVPGAWEIPLALTSFAATGNVDALVALGVVVRGETPHFEYICSACTQGIAKCSADTGLPIGFGLLTCDTSAQAEERAGGKAGNKGTEAAQAAVEMLSVLELLSERSEP